MREDRDTEYCEQKASLKQKVQTQKVQSGSWHMQKE